MYNRLVLTICELDLAWNKSYDTFKESIFFHKTNCRIWKSARGYEKKSVNKFFVIFSVKLKK